MDSYNYENSYKNQFEFHLSLNIDDSYSKMILLDLESIFKELLKTLIDNYDASEEQLATLEEVYDVFKDIKEALKRKEIEDEYNENR